MISPKGYPQWRFNVNREQTEKPGVEIPQRGINPADQDPSIAIRSKYPIENSVLITPY
jgi:hypothetical protein